MKQSPTHPTSLETSIGNRTSLAVVVAFMMLPLLSLSVAVAGDDGAVAYGEKLTDARIVSIGDLLASPDDFVGDRVRIEGRIDAVCPMRGCWLDVQEEEGDRILRFKVQDGEIEFPGSAKGKSVVAEGVFTRIEMDDERALAYAKHMAEEQGRAFDPETDEVAKVIYRIEGNGALVK